MDAPAAKPGEPSASELLARLRAVAMRVAEKSKAARSRPLSVGGAADGLTGLVDFSILSGVSPAERTALLEAAAMVPGADRAAGALVGLAVGDGLGAPFEFLPCVDDAGEGGASVDLASLCSRGTETAPETTRGKQLKEGQWTDDTAMALCLADSLLTGRYDGSDARARFWNWWHRGYNNGFRNDHERSSKRSVGLGMNVGKSLDAMEHGVAPPPRYDVRSEDSGNGSLVRLAPVPLALAGDVERAMAVSAESSRTTHPGRVASAACRFVGFLLCKALVHPAAQTMRQFLDLCAAEYLEHHVRPADAEMRRLLQSAEPEDSKERSWNWRAERLELARSLAARERDGSYNGYPVSRAYYGSYCMDGLAVALHSAYSTSSFTGALVRCVNFLGDADSTAAICGQICGAFYGLQALDPRLVDRLQRWDDKEVSCKAVLLWTLGAEAEAVDEPEETAPAGAEYPWSPELGQLTEMGFSREQAGQALEQAEGDLEGAAQLLVCGGAHAAKLARRS